ncbi:MAG: 2-C-methyl-D-erythritol 4-phosphate cytidylyltransferase, partial [Clostridia bacterium]|nr:2-C-methyl-D-erythritol 4-phosphate cytidylyltransferase [Clostridia bacterium]
MYTNDDRSSELKKLSDLLRTAAGKPRKIRTAAIIVAAGSSSRMGGPDKLHLPLCGMPVAVHSLLAYEAAAYIDVVCAVVKKTDVSLFETYREKFAIKKLTLIVPGSDTRQKSVLRGVEALSEYNPDYFAIADGARPLTDPRTVDLCCLAAYRFGAATAAVPATDTVKIRDSRGFI